MSTQNKPHKVSPTLAIHQVMQQRKANGLVCYCFGFGQSPFPVPNIMVEALKNAAQKKAYLPSRGLPELCKKIANYYHNRYQILTDENQVIIGPGSKELLFLSQLIFERDLVLPAPSWVSYAPQANYLGKKCHWVPCQFGNDFKIKVEDLDATLSKLSRPALLILNSPNNPTGHVYSKEELEALALVAKNHQLVVIADEIYGEYSFGDYHSFTQSYPEGTILCSGLSKSRGAGGWRLGWMHFPSAFQEKLIELTSLASETFSCVASPIQYAALSAFDAPEIKDYVEKSKHVLQCVGQYIHTNLTGNIQSIRSAGGFYSMVKFSNKLPDDSTICNQLMEETGIALLAGQHFGNPPNAKTARLAFVDFDGKAILDDTNLKHLDHTLNSPHFEKLKTGVHILNDWANAL